MNAIELQWASPLPPIRSGVADYAAEILPHLAASAPVEVVRPPGWEPPDEGWAKGLRFVPADSQPKRGQIPILHLGNNQYHLWIAHRLRCQGGVVVLHDAVLHHLLVEEAAGEGAWERFARELEAAYPGRGAALARARRWGFSGLLDPFLFPARSVLLSKSRAVLVHSRRAAAAVAAELPGVSVRHVPLAVARLAGGQRAKVRARLGVAPGETVAVHLGYLTPAKGLATVLEGVAALRALGVMVRLLVVGEGGESSALDDSVARLGIAAQVTRWGWASQEELAGILAAADLGVVPRYPTAGETSAAVLRFLAAGRPVLVSGYGQFLEFPEEAAKRLSPGPAGVADFVRWVVALRGRSWTQACRAAQRAWQEGEHEPQRAAARLLQAVAEVVNGMAR